MNNLTNRTLKRLESYPLLKNCVHKFIDHNGCSPIPHRLTDLTVYIRMLNIFEPDVFRWNDFVYDEFCSWGHNSRYKNVLEPMLCYNLNIHICRLLNYLDWSGVKEPDIYKEDD